jgi:hypothetical protein
MRQSAEIVQFQKKQEFICSACGADRGCNCNAPAVEKLAQKLEQDRQRSRRAYHNKKTQQKQPSSHVRDDEIPTEEEAEQSWQDDLYDQACFLLAQMGNATRQRLFAHIRRKYGNDTRES